MSNYIVVLLMLFAAVNLKAQNEHSNSAEAIKATLVKKSSETKTLEATFKQTKQLDFMKENQVSSGNFYYKRKGKFRWEQKAPTSYIILVNDDLLRIQDGGKVKKINNSKRMIKEINQLILEMISGKIYNNKAFSSTYSIKNNQLFVKLIPTKKPMNSFFNSIELYFDNKKLTLNSMIFNQASGDTVITEFYSVSFNQSIDDKLFLQF